MLDHYASDQYRNWFNDHYHRVAYGLSTEPDCSVRERAKRLITGFVTPVITVVIVPVVAINLIRAAIADPLARLSEQALRWEALSIFLISLSWVFLHLRFLPGRRYDGPVCGAGLRPTYKRNGFAFFLLTFAIIGTVSWLRGPSTFVLLPGLSLISVVLSILASLAAYTKACLAPDPSQFSAPSNLISDVFHGLELYPKLGEVHMKQALIRLGAVLNLLVLWSCFFAQLSPNIVSFVIIGVQFLHAARRFWNEECYSHSMEVSYYKFGLRELLRHLVLKPFLLNLGTISNVFRPPSCRPSVLIGVFVISTSSIALTYMVDRQKFLVKRKKGKCMTWGRMAETINAFYVDEHGLRRASILLYSGFWGLARHLNYTFEFITYSVLAAPALLNLDWFAAVPPGLLLLGLIKRDREDSRKCRRKYGPYWNMYCEKVRYRFLPWLW